MRRTVVLVALSSLATVYGQRGGIEAVEKHPVLTWQKCTRSGGCQTQSQGKIVLDADWRWIHAAGGFSDCYTGQTWNPTMCPDPVQCARNCAIEGADYAYTYGITTSGNSLTMKYFTHYDPSGFHSGGTRVYLLADNTHYEMFKLKNQEFAFDVDVSDLPCGLNGAVYFTAMDADGGLSKYPNNKAGAKYGTGYCDSKCPKDIKFINGEANIVDWTPSPTDPNTGTGRYGSCCDEMDVWEANSISTAYTPHPCTSTGQTLCDGTTCTSTCDQAGCDFNPYRLGNKTFYGRGLTIDSSKKVTVVTQFITSDGTANGTLSEIRRLYVQNGKVIKNSITGVPGMPVFTSVSDAFCSAQKTAFSETNTFSQKGGFSKLSKAFDAGMVLTLSVRDDPVTNMLWLDSTYPVDRPAYEPGVARGTCPSSSYPGGPGIPEQPDTYRVTYSNIKFGDIGSTYSSTLYLNAYM
ncbi:hypothetical protein FRC12_007092 [Ceratobasidium sp. 428]|nr:hypothetical protein FRC12_007092 [Ceratobasidium sp. 428]